MFWKFFVHWERVLRFLAYKKAVEKLAAAATERHRMSECILKILYQNLIVENAYEAS